MTSPLTEEKRFFGGLGLAILIAELATERAYGEFSGCRIRLGDIDSGPLPRDEAEAGQWPASAEYYRICDRIARGEAP